MVWFGLRLISLFAPISSGSSSGERRSDHCLPENLLPSPFISRLANNSHRAEGQLCEVDHSSRLTQFKTTGFTISPSTAGYFLTLSKHTSRSGMDLRSVIYSPLENIEFRPAACYSSLIKCLLGAVRLAFIRARPTCERE